MVYNLFLSLILQLIQKFDLYLENSIGLSICFLDYVKYIPPYANVDKNWQYSVFCIFLWTLFEVIEVYISEVVYVLGLKSRCEKNKTLLFLDGQFTIDIVLIENRVWFCWFSLRMSGKKCFGCSVVIMIWWLDAIFWLGDSVQIFVIIFLILVNNKILYMGLWS